VYNNYKKAIEMDKRLLIEVAKNSILEEFQKINIEISILTIPKLLEYKDENDLRTKITKNDGIILLLGDKQATFLPSVWKEVTEFKLFFKYLCLKAGVNENCLDYHPTIYTYQAKIIEENQK
jgi:AMMECR1 domain-containing protein